MSDNKGKAEPAPPPPPPTFISQVLTAYRSLPGAALLFAVVPLLILGYVGWFYWGAEHLNIALYSLKLENLTVTKQPAWISKSNVREEVYRNSSLSLVHLLDRDATATIDRAFDAHAWVQRTIRVQKMGGSRVNVDLVYREPIAMVYYEPTGGEVIPGAKPLEPGVFPVDQAGIVLPTDDFTSDQVGNYFCIFADGAAPASRDAGMPFGDSRIFDALQLCQLLAPQRESLGLKVVYVNTDKEAGARSPWTLSIKTRDHRLIAWGHAPGRESTDEPSADDKLIKLQRWLKATHASTANATLLDLRGRSQKLTGPIN